MTTANIPSRRAMSTWVDLLRLRAEEHPERPAFTFLRDGEEEGARLTYAGLAAAARSLAVRLRESGAIPGERALLLYPPGLDFVVAFFGCLLSGVVAVPAYPPQVSGRRRTDPRLRAIAADARPRFALTTQPILARREAVAAEVPELAAACWLATDAPGELEAADWRAPELRPESLAFLQYTSGSTSDPKGVMVTHGNLLHNEEMIRRACGHTEASVLVGWLPLYHDMGLIANVLQPLYVGARSVLMSPAAFLQKPARWLRAVSRYRGTTSGGPNFAWDLCVRKVGEEERAGLDLSSWRVAFNGAEPVRAETLDRFAEAFAPCGFRPAAVYPCYGLAEATLFVAGREAGRGPAVELSPATGRPLVGCGHAWLEQRIAIVDPEAGIELPPGRIGEIWVSGPSVAAGYWGRPEETERDFAAHLAGRDAEGPFLRTGDLGFLAEGELYVAGRLKDLIILRGRNHYPQDLEARAEGAHPDLQPAGSAAFAVEAEGEERLVIVAEVRRRREAAADVAEIADAVRQAVAEGHEARVHEVVLIRAGTLPRTSSGKVRRRATREAWEAGTLEVLGASRAPEETVDAAGELPLSREALAALPPEERGPALVAALRERVGRVARVAPSRLDPDRPLTALGLDSLMAIELENDLEEALGAHIPLARLLEGATLADLAGDLLAALDAPAGEEPVTPAPPAADHPLSYGQRALWFLEKLHPETVAFLLVGAARVQGELDSAALRRALERVVARHPALRTTFHEISGEPRQRVEVAMGVELVEGEAEGWVEEAYRPFDLSRGPLVRIGVRPGLFFLTIHHLISDFWSLGLLLQELEACYREETGGAPADLAPVTLSFPDFVHWQERRLAGPRGEELWQWWSARLAGAPMALDLPTDRPRPPVRTSRGAAEALTLPPELVMGLEALGRGRGATLYMTLLAGFEALLGRWTGQDDLLLGSPTTGRGPAELAGVMGYFINPLVHRADLAGDPPFLEHLARVRAGTLGAFAHQDYPFPLLAERLQPERDPSRSPVFQVFFVLEQARLLHERGLSAFALGEEGARMELLGASLESLRLPRRSSQFDLMLLLARLDGGMALTLEYNPDLFDASTVRRLLGGYRTLLESAAADPWRPIGLLRLLTPAEESELVAGWNARGPAVAPLPEDAALHRLFAARAALSPDAVAVVHEVEALTYGQLDARANRLARRLRALGVGPEVPVGLCVERSLDLIVGLLGILKAGGAYVPVDPSSPEERREWILEDAFRGVERAVVVTADFVNDPSVAAESPDPLPPAGGGGHLAYVIYTSGSTGRPKGVAVTHANAVRLLRATEPWFGFGPDDVWTLFHSFAFDFSVWEIWGALAYGGRLVIVPRAAALSPQGFHELLATEGVTVLNQTPSAFRQLAQVEVGEPLALRLVIFGGEALEPASLRPWARRHGLDRPRLVNMYGITETTVHVTYRPQAPCDLDGPGFLGVPIPDLQVYLLDRRLQPVPEGVPGEIFVGGAGVARGYLGRPDLTAERFVPDPFADRAGARLYRSGDLARFRRGPEGLDLESLGRADHQVKIRGFRIEPGEIEAALRRSPAVRECVVLARRDGGETRLVAYVAPHPGAGGEGLRAWLAERLPDYMVPSVFVILEALPLTAHGKVDRAALLRLEPGAAAGPGARVAPRTSTEAALAHVWSEVLGVEEVGVEDDFFEVGGHSLKATELVAGVARRLGVELPLHTLFSAPTVAGLARAVEALRGTAAEPVALPAWKAAPADRHEPFPLTEIQQAYWIGRSGVFELGTVSTQSYLEIEAETMELDRLERAWQRLIDRHDMLRAVVGRDGLQRVLPEVPPYRFEVLDLRGRPGPEAEAELLAVRARMAHQVLPADQWPLFEIRATRLDGRVRLHARLDALIYDASSAHVLLEEWMALTADPEAELPPLNATFREYVLTARELAGTPAWKRAREYWRERAATLPPAPDLPLARDPSALREHRFVRRSFRLPAAVWGRLKARAARVGVGPSALLAAVWAEALAPWSRSPRFTLNLTLFQRLPLHPEVGRIVGDFTSLILLEIDTAGTAAFEGRARRVQERLWRDLDHRQESGLEVLREMGRRRGGAPAGMPVVFTSMLGLDVEMVSDRLPGRIVHSITQTSQIWLDHQVSEERGELVTNWDGVDELFPPGLVDDLFAAYRRLLDLLAADMDESAWTRPIPALRPLLLPPEQLRRREAVNATAAPLLESLTGPALLQEPFFVRAAERPDAPAVLWDDGALSYGELARRARRLARHLRERGARPGQLVAVALDKGWEQAVAVLGVLASGAAYLPLDPGLPAERFRHLLARGEAALAVTSPGLANRLTWPDGVTVVTVDEAPAGEDGPLPPVQQEDDLAYVIFTSGSTGQPKGVAIEHRAALNTVLDVNRRFGIGPEDRVLALSSLSFDLSVWDLFGLWAAGGAVVLPGPEAARDPAAWTGLATAGRVTVWNSVPALLGLWVEFLERHPERHPDAMRLALLSGDWIPVALPDRLRRIAPGVRVVSLGGATEASIWSILHEIGPVDPGWTSIPYGRPMANQTFHVLDESFAPRPDGVPGALWIGGAGLARGYWRDEERTVPSFVRHPGTGERLYRTGDVGLWRPEGEIELLGREDFQVKIQGYRIELGEIEAALLDHPDVRAAVATASHSAGDPAGERRLLAFVVAEPGVGDVAARLRAWLEARLPRYMVPSSIQELPALPLTATGKVDRGALPHLRQPPAPPEPAAPALPAASPVARRIALLVAETMAGAGIDAAGLNPEANLLELGATSLEIIRLANRLEEELGARPPVQSFYGAPTLATLVRFYEERDRPMTAAATSPVAAAFPLIVEPAEREAFKLRRPGLRPLDGRETVALPDGDRTALDPLYALRASHRCFAQAPVPLASLAGLLAALRPASRETFKHLYPSAGGLYPVQVYLHAKAGRIDGLPAGTWYYHPAEHRLLPLTPSVELPPEIHDPFINRPVFDESAFSLFLVADLGAIAPIYGEPSLTYATLEAGYMGQLLMMRAAGHGLGLCPIGQVDFDRIRHLFDLGEGHALVHALLGGGLDESRESAPQALGEAWSVRIDGGIEEGEL